MYSGYIWVYRDGCMGIGVYTPMPPFGGYRGIYGCIVGIYGYMGIWVYGCIVGKYGYIEMGVRVSPIPPFRGIGV